MKIGIDARLFGLENAGLGRYSIGLVTSLAKLDTENQYYVLLREKYYNKLNFPSNWHKVLVEIKHYSLAEQTKLPSILNELNLDLVHFLHFNVPVKFKGKYVVTIHDLIMHDFSGRETTTQPFYKYGIKRLGYKYVFGKAVSNASKLIAPSEFIKHQLKKHYKFAFAKTEVIYEGVSVLPKTQALRSRLPLKYDLEKPYFIYTGNAYPHKNLARAIEAVVYLNESLNCQAQLAIVSSRNIFAERLNRYIAKANAQKYIKLLGFVSDQELDTLYKCSVGFVYPSLYEGFGLPGLEAMISGTVLLASDISVFREIYKDTPVYFNPHDFSSIAGAMKKVINFVDSERQIYIKRGKKQAERYSWDVMAKQTIEVYESILKPQ